MARAKKASRRASGGLTKWFKEDWRDISTKDKSGKHPKCGRKSAENGADIQMRTRLKSRVDVCLAKRRATARKRATRPASGGGDLPTQGRKI